MVLIKSRPITPGQRGRVRVSTPDLHKGKPCAALLQKKRKTAGRNNHGRITAWHRGGGSRQHYRLVDFKRNKDGVPAKVERLEYDPNRSAHLALLLYADGERRYIIAPQGVKAGGQNRKRCQCSHSPGQCQTIIGYSSRRYRALCGITPRTRGATGTGGGD